MHFQSFRYLYLFEDNNTNIFLKEYELVFKLLKLIKKIWLAVVLLLTYSSWLIQMQVVLLDCLDILLFDIFTFYRFKNLQNQFESPIWDTPVQNNRLCFHHKIMNLNVSYFWLLASLQTFFLETERFLTSHYTTFTFRLCVIYVKYGYDGFSFFNRFENSFYQFA